MALTEKEKTWFENQIQKYDEKGEIIELDNSSNLIKYTSSMRSDESLIKAQIQKNMCMRCFYVYYVVHNIDIRLKRCIMNNILSEEVLAQKMTKPIIFYMMKKIYRMH